MQLRWPMLAGLLLFFGACGDDGDDGSAGPDVGTNAVAGTATDAEGICPGASFAGCGGDLAGGWQLVDFCADKGPAATPRECEGPGEDEAACQAAPNLRSCSLVYGGAVDFEPGGELVATFSAGIRVLYVMDDLCLAALAPSEAPEAACAGIQTDRLPCAYAADVFRCEAETEPEVEEVRITYSIDGAQLTVGGATGGFCVVGARLVIDWEPFGPEGWAAWILDR